ncbi:MAG: DUF1292 domain-containing protein [Christensenellaceae bacterium]|nr:DUF1292 domain-containing protein [Christensenellaceae bacterium]
MSDNELMDNIIELTDEEGNTVEFEHLLTFEYKDRFYVGLLPVEPMMDMEEGEVLIMRLEEDGDDDLFLPVETEEELEGAWNAFMESYYEDECDCEGDDCCTCGGGCNKE